MLTIKPGGWTTWSDWGSDTRYWEFLEAVAKLGVEKGDTLWDRGPRFRPSNRFCIRRGKEVVSEPTAKLVAETLFRGVLPGWRPPRDREMIEALKSLTSAMQSLASVQRGASDAEKRLAEISKVVNGKAPDPKPATKENAFVRLVGEYEYNNGTPYTVWELKVDVPSVPLTRSDAPGKRHAQAGDQLIEEEDDDLTPFKLKRNKREVGTPEWWQLRELFVGLEDAPEAPVDPLQSRYLRMVPGAVEGGRIVLYAMEAVRGTIVRAGDYLVEPWMVGDVVKGAASIFLPHAQARAVHDELNGRVRVVRPYVSGPYTPERHMKAFLKSIKRKPHPRARPDSAPLRIVRPISIAVSDPVRATSDDAALFELLAQVGGRMPSGRGAADV